MYNDHFRFPTMLNISYNILVLIYFYFASTNSFFLKFFQLIQLPISFFFKIIFVLGAHGDIYQSSYNIS
jgi:hypothetical protein